MPVLVIQSEGLAGQRFSLRPEGTVIGRDPGSAVSVALLHETVSGRHANILLDNGVWLLRNLSRTNGTVVDGARIHGDLPLRSGARISFGEVSATFESDEPPPPPPPLLPPPDLLRDLRKGVQLLRDSARDGNSYVQRLERGLGKLERAAMSGDPEDARLVAARLLEKQGDLHELAYDLGSVFEAFEGALNYFEERIRAAERR